MMIVCCQGSVCPQDPMLGKESYFNSSMFPPISIICCQGSVCPQDPMPGKGQYFNSSMLPPISMKIWMKAFRLLCKLKIYDTLYLHGI